MRFVVVTNACVALVHQIVIARFQETGCWRGKYCGRRSIAEESPKVKIHEETAMVGLGSILVGESAGLADGRLDVPTSKNEVDAVLCADES